MRYYHGLIDTHLLSTGSGYKSLPNVVTIVILPYDPFDKSRMIYTVRNSCVEDTTVEYNDGAEQMSQLILRLTEAGRIDDLTRAASDADYRKQLLIELGICVEA